MIHYSGLDSLKAFLENLKRVYFNKFQEEIDKLSSDKLDISELSPFNLKIDGRYGEQTIALTILPSQDVSTYQVVDRVLYCENDSVEGNTLILSGEVEDNTLILN